MLAQLASLRLARRPYVLALVVVGCALMGSAAAAAGTAGGSISGVVFHDIDGDGVRDQGEPGLQREVRLRQEGKANRSTFSHTDGAYSLDDIEPGQYELSVNTTLRLSLCVISGGFSPLRPCWNVKDLWHPTTPDTFSVVVAAGSTATIDFGAQPDDVFVATATVVVEDDYAPAGVLVESFVNGQECGTATVPSHPRVELHVLGAGEREGCAVDGDTIEFKVDGVTAKIFLWESVQADVTFTPGGSSSFTFVAMEQHAWYWFERYGDDRPADGVLVQAVVDGVICGEATVVDDSQQESAGFWRLIVPSDTLQPGCGGTGESVSFLVDGVLSTTTIGWEPGIQEIDLMIPAPPAGATPPPPATEPAATPTSTSSPTGVEPTPTSTSSPTGVEATPALTPDDVEATVTVTLPPLQNLTLPATGLRGDAGDAGVAWSLVLAFFGAGVLAFGGAGWYARRRSRW